MDSTSKQIGKSDESWNPENGKQAALNASQRLQRAILKPTISLREVTTARLTEAVHNCFDQSLLLLPGHDDAQHWLDLPGADRKALAQTLSASWYSHPVDDRMHLNLLWRCAHENSHRFGSCKHLRESNVPFWFLLSGPPRPLSDAAATPLKSQPTWEKCLDTLFDIRIQKPTEILKFSPAGVQCLIGFINGFNQRLERVPAEFRPFLHWLPEAARRFSFMHAIMDASQPEIGPESVDSAIKIINWMGTAHLRAIITGIPTTRVKPAGKRQISPDERMIGKVRLKQPVLWSDLRRSYPDSKAEPLVAIRDRLIAEDRLKWTGHRLELNEASVTV